MEEREMHTGIHSFAMLFSSPSIQSVVAADDINSKVEEW